MYKKSIRKVKRIDFYNNKTLQGVQQYLKSGAWHSGKEYRCQSSHLSIPAPYRRR